MTNPRLSTNIEATDQTRTTLVPVKSNSVSEQNDATDADGLADNAASIEDEQECAAVGETSDGVDLPEVQKTASEDNPSDDAKVPQPRPRWRRIRLARVFAFGVLPVLALSLAAAGGFLKWQDWRAHRSGVAGIESVNAAKESTVALLSYQPDSIEKDLGSAQDRLTGKFKDSYTQLIHDVVIPGAKKSHISATATVPAASSVSATPDHAVALVFVNQTVIVGNDAPTDTASAVRVTLEKNGNRWLISAFDPV